MSDGPHMSWCTGAHDDGGLCEHSGTLELGETAQYSLLAAPCSDGAVQAWFGDAWFYEPSDFDTAIAHLTQMRANFVNALVEADCEQHEHVYDEDDED